MSLGREVMFCPQCGTLAFPTPSGKIYCTNYKCGYDGPAISGVVNNQGEFVDLNKLKSTKNSENRKYSVTRSSDVPKMVEFGRCKFCNQETELHITTQTLYGADDDISKTYAKCTYCEREFERL